MNIAPVCPCCGSANLKKNNAEISPFVAARIALDNSRACRSLLCERCGLLFLDARYDDNEMERLYRDYRGEEYVQLREMFESGYTERNKKLLQGYSHIPKIEEFLSPYLSGALQVLDYGGDTGINTPFAKEAKRLDIYDINGKKTKNGNKIRRIERTYDLVICSQVLEHIPYPDSVIKDIKQGMSKETILYIDVPYQTDVTLENKRIWHEHINFFSVASLAHLLERRNLQIKVLSSLDIASDGCILMLICKMW